MVTISLFAINTRLLHFTIVLLVALFETNKTVSLDVFFPSCNGRERFTLINLVLSTAKNANHCLSSSEILR